MATATFSSGADVDPEQQQEVAGSDTEDSQDWPDVEETTQGVPGSSKSKGETGDQPQQAEGGAQAPPKEIPPVTRNQAPARMPPRTPPRTQPRTPPRPQLRIPPRTPPKNLRKIHQHLQNMVKHTDRQASYG